MASENHDPAFIEKLRHGLDNGYLGEVMVSASPVDTGDGIGRFQICLEFWNGTFWKTAVPISQLARAAGGDLGILASVVRGAVRKAVQMDREIGRPTPEQFADIMIEERNSGAAPPI